MFSRKAWELWLSKLLSCHFTCRRASFFSSARVPQSLRILFELIIYYRFWIVKDKQVFGNWRLKLAR